MQSPSKSSVVSSVVVRAAFAFAVAGGSMFALTGCEKSAGSELSKSVDKGSGLIRGSASDEAVTVLEPVSKQSAAVGATLHVKYTLGHAKLSLARAKAAELDAVYLDVARLQGEIAQIGTAISVGNTLVDGYRKQDPTDTRALIQQRIAEAQGDATKTIWIETAKEPIPTISASKQKVSSLEQQVAAKQDEIRKLKEERSTALQTADQLRESSDSLKGRQAVDAYAKASGARKDVSIISGKLDTAEGELVTVQRDLAVAQGLLDVVLQYVEVLKQHDKALASGFDGISAQIATQLGVSKQAASAPAEGTGDARVSSSVAAKADELAADMEKAATLHTEAEALFVAATEAYESAFTEATKYRTDLSTRLELYRGKSASDEEAIASLQRAVWPSVYRIQQGVAIAGLGDLYARRAQTLDAQTKLVAAVTPVLKKAEIAVPAKLTVDATATKAATDTAAENYTKAVAELDGAADNIQGQDPEKRRQAASVARVYILHAWSKLLATTGDAEGAKAKMEIAKNLRDSVLSQNDNKFPAPLPPELAAATAPATTEPATP